jgi:hypothetical protein
MRPADISQVVAIDEQSFDPPWSVRSYRYEISESNYSHMVVLAHDTESGNGWRRWFGPLSTPDSEILGYGGLWWHQFGLRRASRWIDVVHGSYLLELQSAVAESRAASAAG